MEQVDVLVVGGGVIGLAAARALALAGREVVLIEAADAIGTGISSRNSEVIHAGIYYPTGSLKARLCVQGRRMLYRYCEARGIAHRRTGKLIVATSHDQVPRLHAILRQARANGVEDITLLDTARAQTLEPQLHCVTALHSPATGIIDSHALMLSLRGEAEAHGATVACHSPFVRGRVRNDGIEVEVGGEEAVTLRCRALVNAAGLDAWRIARNLDGFARSAIPPRHLAKGNYFSLAAGRAPFSHLIYPVPEDGGLGVHLTLDMSGRARFGPDVEWLRAERPFDFDVCARRGEAFYASIRRYWPGLTDGALAPAYSGVRPKLSGPGEAAADFMIQGPADHGAAGLVNLFGIESPGLTSCLAIAEAVKAAVGRDGSGAS